MADMVNVDANLEAKGIVLPDAPRAAGRYLPVMMQNGIGYVSGQFPIKNGSLVLKCEIDNETNIELLKEAIAAAALNVLSQIKQALGKWERLVSLGRVDGYFVCSPEFEKHPELLDVASDLFVQLLGEKGLHARTVFGVNSLPFRSPVELVVQFFYRD